MHDALDQIEKLANLRTYTETKFEGILKAAKQMGEEFYHLVDIDFSNLELSPKELEIADKIATQIKTSFDFSIHSYTGKYKGFFMKWDYSDSEKNEISYDRLCRYIAQYIVLNSKILDLDIAELITRINFDFNTNEVVENYGEGTYTSMTFGSILFKEGSDKYTFRINLIFILLLNDIYTYIEESTHLGEEFDNVKLAECAYALEYLYEFIIRTICHEMYHVAQFEKKIKYSDDLPPSELSYISYLLSMREATARLYADEAVKTILDKKA